MTVGFGHGVRTVVRAAEVDGALLVEVARDVDLIAVGPDALEVYTHAFVAHGPGSRSVAAPETIAPYKCGEKSSLCTPRGAARTYS